MIPCNCIYAEACRCLDGPENTSCITVQAKDVRVGDFLDTREPGGRGFIARVFTPPAPGRGGASVVLNVAGQRPQIRRKTENVKVWRDSRIVPDVRPIDLRTDRPVENLTHAMTLGRAGLNNIFPIGSLWEVGPFCHGVNPLVVRVVSKNEQGAAFTSGTNYSHAPEDAAALGKATWFINCETVYSPHSYGRSTTGQPPAVLCALTPRMAAVAGVACCDCATYVEPCRCRVLSCNAGVIQSMRAEAESLRQTIDEQDRTLRETERNLAAAQLRANTAEATLARVKAAL